MAHTLLARVSSGKGLTDRQNSPAPRFVLPKSFLWCVMTKCVASIFLAALAITYFSLPLAAFAKQQCSASISSNPHSYWSWRLIDGRKCWYEGKPMLSKTLLEWPTHVADQPSPPNEELASALATRSRDPLDAQAKATDPETFDALWNARIGGHY